MINTHDVTIQNVLDRLPMSSGSVTADSQGLNTGMIEGWIQSGSGVLNSILRSQGKDPDELGPDEAQLVRQGIISFAEAKCLAARDYDDQTIDRAERGWNETRKIIRDIPSDMAPSDEGSRRIRGNSSDDSTSRWDTSNFGGW